MKVIFVVLIWGCFVFSSGEKISIVLSVRNLPSLDPFNGAPDPYAKVYFAQSNMDPYREVGRTKHYSDVHNADWPESFDFNYVPGANQRLKIDIMDSDFEADDYMGFVELNFASYVNSHGRILEENIKSGTGRLIIKSPHSALVSSASIVKIGN